MNKFTQWIVLSISILLTILTTILIHNVIVKNENEKFDAQVNETASAIQLRIKAYEQVLSGAKGLFAASQTVSREEWKTFVEVQSAAERFPGIQGIGYSKFIGNKDNLASHIEQIRSEGFPDYAVKPDGNREEYHAIIYIEPFDERNQQVFGYDMSTESIRYEGMNLARDTGLPTLTGKIKLLQETETDLQPGFLLYNPVYANGELTQSLEQRQSVFEGFVYAAFRMNNFMSGILGPTTRNITFVIYDTNLDPKNLMYDYSKINNIEESEIDYSLSKSVIIDLDQRQWILKATALNSIHSIFGNILLISIIITGFSLSILLCIIIRNYTKIIVLSEQSFKREKMSVVGEMSARMAHDIRNPLSVINSEIQMLKYKNILNENQVRRIDNAIKRITHQTEEVLDYVHITPLSVSKFNLVDLAKESIDTMMIPSDVKITISDKEIFMHGDKHKIEVVLINLIFNSIQSIENDGGTIDVILDETEREVIIEIKDSGPGIKIVPIEKVFDSLITTKQKGTGLGLTSVKNIVNQHGGTVSVKNNPTTFTVKIPKRADSY